MFTLKNWEDITNMHVTWTWKNWWRLYPTFKTNYYTYSWVYVFIYKIHTITLGPLEVFWLVEEG